MLMLLKTQEIKRRELRHSRHFLKFYFKMLAFFPTAKNKNEEG